jgi:tetratricopeptide (TPR) repeat protein
MTERERYRTRGLFYMITGDDQACVKEYSDLLARYAADTTAHNNLALCSTHLRNMPRALEEMQRVVSLLPKRALYRVNLALYAAYAGDFETAEREARAAQELGSALGLLPMAFAELGQGQLSEVRQTYDQFARAGGGASWAASGLGDLAVYEGRFTDAARILEQGAAADAAAKNPDRAAAKLAALAHSQALQGRKRPAIAAAERALAASNAAKIRFQTARVFADTGETGKARKLAAGLATELQAEPRAYARIIDGDLALGAGDLREAIKAFTDANALVDTWIGHFDLGRAYLAASAYIQADSEFDRCLKRRGEALALFLDEEATYGYLPEVYYFQGRVREGLKSPGSAESYRAYLAIRGRAGEDPLLADVNRRAAR